MTYGPNPWLQKSWDARAAGNFMAGGAGAGLMVFVALSGWRGAPAVTLWLVGMALVSTGLLLVWLEIGRPLRALNVFFNPRTSWMTRESLVAAALLSLGLLTVLGVVAYHSVVAALALAFVYCQARILHAARGIVAWRQPMTTPLVLLTGLVEGGGLFCVAATAFGGAPPLALAAFAVALLARTLLARLWRQRLGPLWAPRPMKALNAMVAPLWLAGGLAPLMLIVLAQVLPLAGAATTALWGLAGALAAAGGAAFKFHLVTRAAFNQGFSLTQLPVRGVRRVSDPR
jgi:phenylacetyl-CoA:acceptor oxidoreductase subunit 2